MGGLCSDTGSLLYRVPTPHCLQDLLIGHAAPTLDGGPKSMLGGGAVHTVNERCHPRAAPAPRSRDTTRSEQALQEPILQEGAGQESPACGHALEVPNHMVSPCSPHVQPSLDTSHEQSRGKTNRATYVVIISSHRKYSLSLQTPALPKAFPGAGAGAQPAMLAPLSEHRLHPSCSISNPAPC